MISHLTVRTLSSRNQSGCIRRHRYLLDWQPLESRVTPYSASGNLWPQAQLIKVSFVPDGTNFNGYTSNLISSFNSKFGSATTWQNLIKKAAQYWAQQTNINFEFVADSGAAIGSGNYQQGDPSFGDIRIGGYNFGNTNLATAFLPPAINNYSIAGDFAFNTSQTFKNGQTYDLFTVASHEFGHALGLYHGTTSSIMASAYPGTKTALTTDDISGIRSIYSAGAARSKDAYDAVATNETSSTATNITSTINATSKTALITNLDLSTSTDIDWYKFTAPAGSATTLKATVRSLGFSQMDPKLEIYGPTVKVLKSVNAGTYGATLTATATIAAGSVYYVKVFSADAIAAFKTGKYALTLNMGTGPDPTIPLPNTTVSNGSPISSGGGIALVDGVESRVNTTTAGNQALSSLAQPSVGIDSTGNTVTVWSSFNQDTSNSWGVYSQRIGPTGAAQGVETRVNSTTTGDQMYPAVSRSTNGSYVVAWASQNQDALNSWGVYAQLYDASGTPVGSEFQVNTTTAGDQSYPAVAMDGSGNFVVAWSSYNQDAANTWGVYAQRFSAAGAPLGSEFRANTWTTGDQMYPAAGISSTGAFAIGWSSLGQDATNSWGAYAQLFDINGNPMGSEFRVNSTTAGDQKLARAAMDGTGNFVLVWSSSGQDGGGLGIYAQRYNNQGVAQGAEFRVNTTTSGDQTNPAIAMDTRGNFMIAWDSYNQDATSTWGVYAQQYTSNGTKLENEFRINTTTAGNQQFPSVTMNSIGQLRVVWSGNGTGDADGVFMQRYSVNTSAEIPGGFDTWNPLGEDHDHDHDHDHDRSQPRTAGGFPLDWIDPSNEESPGAAARGSMKSRLFRTPANPAAARTGTTPAESEPWMFLPDRWQAVTMPSLTPSITPAIPVSLGTDPASRGSRVSTYDRSDSWRQ